MNETRTAQANPARDDTLEWLDDHAAILPLIESLAPVEALDVMFARHRGLQTLILDEHWQSHPQWQTLCQLFGAPRVPRARFHQQPWHWLKHAPHAGNFDAARGHPALPLRPAGRVYERFDTVLGMHLSFRTIDARADLERLTRWMNTPRVARFWEQAKSRTELADWLDERLAQPHRLSLIGEFNDQPFGYFELYWAAGDVIAPYYVWEGFDRGLHVLVGEEEFRGADFVTSWLKGLQHYAYLSEPRTDRLVLEPDAGNARLFRHLERLGLFSQREFDLPDKRAALVMGWRTQFFSEVM